MAEPDIEIDTPTKKTGGKKGARASIQVSDIPMDPEKASDMMAAASGTRRRGGRGGGETDDRASLQRFSRAIKDPNNKIVATRQQPPVTSEGVVLQDTYDVATHEGQSEEEIKRDISEARGGRKWILRVFDPDEPIIASRSVIVGGEPRVDPMFANVDLQEEPVEQQQELTEEELLEQTLARDPQVIKAQRDLRLKQIANQQEEEEAKSSELRARRVAAEKAAKGGADTGDGRRRHRDEEEDEDDRLMKVIEASNAPLKEANAALQRRLDDAEKRNSEKKSKADQQRMIEAQTGPLKEMLAAQKTAMDQMMAKLTADSSKGASSDVILSKLESLKTEIKSDTKDQIMAVVTQLTSKIDTVATTMNAFMSKSNDPATTALIALATKGGQGGTAEKDPWSGLERALKALQSLKTVAGMDQTTVSPPDFPSYLVEKMAETTPTVLEFFKEQRGAVPTKDEIEKMMRGAAMNMYKGLNETMQKELQAAFLRIQNGQAPAIQQTQPGAPSATPGPEVTVQPTAPGTTPSVVAFPGGAAPPATPPPTAAPAASAPATGTALTPDQLYQSLNADDRKEYSKRVNFVLTGLAREMELGIQAMGWPEQAQLQLPKAIVDQLVEATKDGDIYDIVKHYADQKVLDKIWGYLSESHKNHEWYQGWLAQGINWIKEANGVEIVEEGEPPVVEDGQ